MNRHWLLLLVFLTAQAQAFPIILAGAGAFAAGTAFIPLLLTAFLMFLGVKLWRLPKVSLVLIALTSILACGVIWAQWSSENREAILSNTESLGAPAQLSTDIPYAFVSDSEQARSPSRMSAGDFYEQLSKRAIRIIRVDLEPQLFADFGFGATATQIHDNPDPIVALAKKRLQGVVLVDERGNTAAAIADALNKQFGTQIRFLQGGANALNDYAWDKLDSTGDSRAVQPSDVPRFKEANNPEVISTTNSDEFLNYGWMHGLTLSLPVFLSGADAIASRLEGKTVLITAAESHYSGDTWILLDMLRARGIDAYFMQPTREELLIKPAYFKSYKNVDRYIGADETLSYILGTENVRFLDFQPAIDWARTKNQLPRTDHIDMETVAKGDLGNALAKLDQTKQYLGLAYDRRTFYHSILAGELLSASGVTWLGIDTQPERFNRAMLTDQDLIDPIQALIARAQNQAVQAVGALYAILPGSKVWLIFLNFLVCFVGAVMATKARFFSIKSLAFISSSLASYGLWVAYVETTQVWVTDSLLSLSQLAGALLGWVLVRYARSNLRFGRDSHVGALPDKIQLLEKAALLGYSVEKGYVVSGVSCADLPSWITSAPVIVRSAALSESSTTHTVGVYESVTANGEAEVRSAICRVHTHIISAGETPCCLIQPLLDGQTFGVAMFGTGTDGHLFICESGEGDAVTAGTGNTRREAAPIWESRGLGRVATKVRRALFGLYRDLGATTIEWAISPRGKLTILQVSTDVLGRPSLKRLMALNTRFRFLAPKFALLPTEHDTPIGAAVVSAMAGPGDQCSIGGMRFARQRTFVAARALQLADIVKVLGHLPRTAFMHVPGELLLASFEKADAKRGFYRETIQISTEASTDSLSAVVADELRHVADLYGRFSRISTTSLELRNEAQTRTFVRSLPSTVIGCEFAGLNPSEANAYLQAGGYATVTSFTPTQKPSLDPELISPVIQSVDSPLAWIKDQCAVMMMIELERLRPAINEMYQRGASDNLLRLLPTFAGMTVHLDSVGEVPRTLRELLAGPTRVLTDPGVVVWGIPRSGMDLPLTTPDKFIPGAALYLENTDMSHLALLPQVGALIVRAGSSLSHLLQHARRLNIPHVIGFNGGDEMVGTTVRITFSGEVHSA